MRWQKFATHMATLMCLAKGWGMFASQKQGNHLIGYESSMWHIFCMIGLRPSNLRAGCRKTKNYPVICIEGA